MGFAARARSFIGCPQSAYEVCRKESGQLARAQDHYPGEERPLHKPRSRLIGLPTKDTFGWSVSIAAPKTRLRRSSSIRARCWRKTVELSSFGRKIAAQSSALVLRKNPKAGLLSCCGPSLSISLAIASTASLSALSNVTANRRIASCQARNVLACHSPPGTFELI